MATLTWFSKLSPGFGGPLHLTVIMLGKWRLSKPATEMTMMKLVLSDW
jgi:hypothetical protein